ncbi:MAG: HXXEE domain-containing protein [Bacteroidota bacterium]
MTNSASFVIVVVVLLTMLWFPVGQHSFLIDHWMKVETFGIPFLLIGDFLNQTSKNSTQFDNYNLIGVLFLIAYMIHQFEEHRIDILVNYYALAIVSVNGIVNILATLASDQYNPGLWTSLIIFVPLVLLFYKQALKSERTHKKLISWGLVRVIFAHVIMVGGLVMANVFKLLPETAYFFTLVVLAILPMGLFRLNGPLNYAHSETVTAGMDS